MSSKPSLMEQIAAWQEEARRIPLPVGSRCKRAIGGLPGPAFFPEGFGLTQNAMSKGLRPTYMAVGHNFGCETYLNRLGASGKGREDDIVGTWWSLDRLLNKAGADPDLCFRTNWFIGLLPGNDNDGIFLKTDDERHEEACCKLLLSQIVYLRPHAIILLGKEFVRRSYRISSALEAWHVSPKIEMTFALIDIKGHTFKNTAIRGSNHSANVVALLHPSKGWLNEPKRKQRIGLSEAELIRNALS